MASSVAPSLTSSMCPTSTSTPSSDTSRQHVIFNEFLKWYEDRQISSSTPSVTLTGTSFVSLTHSTSLGPWVLDSSATDHITSNKYFFSSISTTSYLPLITMANGSRVSSHGVGIINRFPSLYIDNVLYVSGFPFNLLFISRLILSLDCVISFTKDFVYLQDRISGQMIGTGCESQSLFHLQTSTHVGTIKGSPFLIHARLSHPSLAKM